MLQSLKQTTLNYLISQDEQASFYEFKYFINDFKAKNDHDKEFVLKVHQRYFTFQCAGLCFGTYILFAYRRMLSQGILSPLTKATIDIAVLTTSLFFASKIGNTSAILDLHPLRKKLIQSADIDYLRHLLAKYKKFDFYKENEYLLYQDVLSQQEFKEFKEQHKFDITKF